MNGTLNVDVNGDLIYTPNPGFLGIDTISYQASDGSLLSNVVTIEIDVQAVPPPPLDPVDPEEPDDPETEDPDDTGETDPEDEDDGEGESDNETTEDDGNNETAPVGTPAEPSDVGVPNLATPASQNSQAIAATQDELVQSAAAQAQMRFVFGQAKYVNFEFDNNASEIERLLQIDLHQAIVWHEWDDSREETELASQSFVVGSAAATAAGLISVGYLFWGLRFGAFMAAFSSAIPSWRLIDPNILLTAYRESAYDKDEIEKIL